MALGARVAKLERRRPGGRGCGVCGFDPGAPVTLIVPPPEVIGEPAREGPDRPDRCPSCKRVLVLRIPPPRQIQEVAA